MSSADFAARLQAAIARHVGVPGTIHDLQRLTGGANKTTWSFDADVTGARAIHPAIGKSSRERRKQSAGRSIARI